MTSLTCMDHAAHLSCLVASSPHANRGTNGIERQRRVELQARCLPRLSEVSAYYRSMGQEAAGSSAAVVAMSRARAARLARLSVRQLTYWDKRGVASPSIVKQVSPGKVVQLYAYRELMALLVAAELREQGISLPHIREVVARLAARGYESPLTQLAFATAGREIFFRNEDGTWEGGRAPDQVIFHQVLNLEPIRARIESSAKRSAQTVGLIEKRRGALGSKALVSGTRIPVATIKRYLDDGADVAEIVQAFPALRVEDVEAVRQAQQAVGA